MTQQSTNPFAYAAPYRGSLQSSFAGLTSQGISAPPGLGLPNTMNIGMPYSLNPSVHAPYDTLAREFNLEPDLVAALAQRLANSGHITNPFGYANVNGQM